MNSSDDNGVGASVGLTILADENIPAADHYFAALGQLQQVNGRQLQSCQLAGVDVLLVRSVTRVNRELLHDSSVRFVGTATSGFDHIDREYLQERGIGFAHAPGSNANSVVEYVLAAIAASGDKLEQLLAGGTVGIIGYGVIGRALAARLDALRVNYVACDPWLDQSTIDRRGTLEQVLSCDVVTLHAELTRKQPWPSYHLLGRAQLQRIGRNALLINASRGSVIDNHALRQLLENQGAPATVLDVWEGEPAINRDLLRRVTLGTPHIAGYSMDGKILATRMLSEALCRHLCCSSPDKGSPAGELDALELRQAASGAQLLRQLLALRYDIYRDDTALRDGVLDAELEDAVAGFDLLRRHYPQRRELAGSQVVANFSCERDRELVRALGCVPRNLEPGR